MSEKAPVSRFGCTGHQGLTPTTEQMIVDALHDALSRSGELTGICSLAEGADQLFADVVLERGGDLEVVIPCANYESTFKTTTDLEHYRRLLGRATRTIQLDFKEPSEEAFWAAGRHIAESCDELLAIWDGNPSKGLGGTGDVVKYARERGDRIRILWPRGSARL